jgi:hypothetical protein
MNNTLSHENFFSGKNELQMFPVDMIEENDFTNGSDEEYADFGFTDDIDTIDSRIDKALAKERRRVFKEKEKASEKLSKTSALTSSGNEVIMRVVKCTEVGTVHFETVVDLVPIFINNKIINKELKKQLSNPELVEVYDEVAPANENEVFKKETQIKGRARLFSESISILNFCKKYKNYNLVLKYERKLKNAFAKNSKRKSRMRISQWRQVAAML